MIEAIVIGYLDGLDGVHAYAERPEQPPAEYLLVEKTGSGYENHISHATMAVQCYADSLLRAAELCWEVETAMRGIVSVPEVSSCRLNSSYNFTDTDSRKYRYQAVFDMTYYMEGD